MDIPWIRITKSHYLLLHNFLSSLTILEKFFKFQVIDTSILIDAASAISSSSIITGVRYSFIIYRRFNFAEIRVTQRLRKQLLIFPHMRILYAAISFLFVRTWETSAMRGYESFSYCATVTFLRRF